MYCLTVLTHGHRQQQLVVDLAGVYFFAELFEKDSSIMFFKVSRDGDRLTNKAFDCGEFKKWVTTFYPENK